MCTSSNNVMDFGKDPKTRAWRSMLIPGGDIIAPFMGVNELVRIKRGNETRRGKADQKATEADLQSGRARRNV